MMTKTISCCAALLLLFACVAEPEDDSADVPLITVDAAAATTSCEGDPNATLADGGQFPGPFGKCSEPPTCSPAVCWVCQDGPAGPRWTLFGDDRCMKPDAHD